MTSELAHIIEQSYQIFKNHKVYQPLDVCTACCVTEAEEAVLVQMSVRHISPELLYTYNTAAKTEHPSLEEFKHFLPRFLDLIAQFKFPSHSVELSLSRFDYYTKEDWSVEERAIIQQFGQAFFKHCLMTYPLPEHECIDSILILLHKSQIDLSKLLKDWETILSQESVLHFDTLLSVGFHHRKVEKLDNAFSDEKLDALLYKWSQEKQVRQKFAQRIEQIIMNPGKLDNRILESLSWTYERLQ